MYGTKRAGSSHETGTDGVRRDRKGVKRGWREEARSEKNKREGKEGRRTNYEGIEKRRKGGTIGRMEMFERKNRRSERERKLKQ